MIITYHTYKILLHILTKNLPRGSSLPYLILIQYDHYDHYDTLKLCLHQAWNTGFKAQLLVWNTILLLITFAVKE